MATNQEILKASDACAREGQTAVSFCFYFSFTSHLTLGIFHTIELSEPGDELDYHYICFTKIKGTIYELDGMKPGPIPVYKYNADTFLEVIFLLLLFV
jgi:Ubiquitin carboxyl-terminal hydrolase, family 1